MYSELLASFFLVGVGVGVVRVGGLSGVAHTVYVLEFSISQV